MDDWIAISNLNDFVFCPYSIYLHNIYYDTDVGEYQALPQTQGKLAHSVVDAASEKSHGADRFGIAVSSERFHIYGKIDVFRACDKTLIERKYQLKKIFRGQIYQLWAQYYCMTEMGYDVQRLAFYEISTKKTISLDIPSAQDLDEFMSLLDSFREFDPCSGFTIIHSKCEHCIYSNMCDKAIGDNVYQ